MGRICYECKKEIYPRKSWGYCPSCGKSLKVCTKQSYLTTLADGAQLTRIEWLLEKIDKKIK